MTKRKASVVIVAYSKCYICTVGQKKKKKKRKKKEIPLFISMKLIPIIMDYCLLEFDALNFFLGVRLHGGSLPNFNFFQCKPLNFSTKS